MSLLTKPIEELVSYILTRLHGGLLLEQLDSSHLQVSVTEGLYILKDIHLNPTNINLNLSESPLHLTSAFVSRVRMELPSLLRVTEAPTNVFMTNVEVELCSADLSGYSVLPKQPSLQVPENEEDMQGVTLLTKTIGNMLSNIKFQIDFLKVKIRGSPDDEEYLQLTVGRVSLDDLDKQDNTNRVKLLTISDLRVSITKNNSEIFEPYNPQNVCVIEEPIQVQISLTKELLSVQAMLDCICVVLAPKQVQVILNLVSKLKKSSFFEEKEVSLLLEAYQAIGEEIKQSVDNTQPQINIRHKDLELGLQKLVVCATLEEASSYRKLWEYKEGPYPGIGVSHLVANLEALRIHHSEHFKFTVGSVQASHFHLANNPALDCSDIYKSARQSYFLDFFRMKNSSSHWSVDLNTQHFCKNRILSMKKSNTEFSSPPGAFRAFKNEFKLKVSSSQSDIQLSAIDLKLNSVLVKQVYSILNPLSFKNSSGDKKPLSISLPFLRLEYNDFKTDLYSETCLCESKNWYLVSELKFSKACLPDPLEFSALQFDLFVFNDSEVFQVLSASNVHFKKLKQSETYEEILEQREESATLQYYEPGQGTISMQKDLKVTEPYCDLQEQSCAKKNTYSKLQVELALKRAPQLHSLHIADINVQVDSASLSYLTSIIPELPQNQDQGVSSAFTIGVDSLSLELCCSSPCSFNTPHVPSAFSCYTLDASVVRTVPIRQDKRKALVTLNFDKLSVVFMKNCIKKQGVFASAECQKIEGLVKQEEFIYNFGEKAFSLYYDKSEDSCLQVELKSWVVCVDPVMEVLDFLKSFELPESKASSNITRVEITLKNIYTDYATSEARVLLFLEESLIITALGVEGSLGLHASLTSARLLLQTPSKEREHPIISKPLSQSRFESQLYQQGFVVVGTLDTLEVFVTVVQADPNLGQVQPQNCPAFLECILGPSCSSVSGNVFLSSQVRSAVLENELFELHLNVGCLIMHLCRKSIDVLSAFVKIPEPEEPIEVIRKDSDVSSDDPDTYSVESTGLTIYSKKPEDLRNINLQDYLYPREDLSEQQAQHSKPLTPLLVEKNLVHAHTDIPRIIRPNTVDCPFHQLKPMHGFPKVRTSMSFFYCSINIYTDDEERKRSASDSVQFKFEGAGVTFSKFPQKLHYSWRLAMTVEEVSIIDHIQKSIVKRALKFDTQYKRPKDSHMLKGEICAVWPRPQYSSELELVVDISILPLKINIDQHLIEFCLALANWQPEESLYIRQTGHPPVNSSGIAAKEPSQTYIQRLTINEIKLNLDYYPHSLGGNYPGANFINLFQIENFNLLLPYVAVPGAKNMTQAMLNAWKVWITHIHKHEVIKFISGLGPIGAIKNLGGALYEVLAVQASSADASEATKQGLLGLMKVFSVESLKVLESFMSGAYCMVQGIGSFTGVEMPSRQALTKPFKNAQYIVTFTQIDKKQLDQRHDKFKD